MRVVQTHSKRVVFGILLSALIVGVMLTIGQVPLAVSQPVTIPAKAVKGAIPMDGANPVWESVPGVIVPLSGQLITTPMHPNISVKSVFVKAMTNGKELGLRIEWTDQTKNDTTIGPQDFRDQAAVIRIAGCAVVGVDSDPGEGELGHVGAADQHRAGGAQPGDRRRVACCGRRVVERLRPGEGPFARDIEQVLDRDRKSGERGGDIARLA